MLSAAEVLLMSGKPLGAPPTEHAGGAPVAAPPARRRVGRARRLIGFLRRHASDDRALLRAAAVVWFLIAAPVSVAVAIGIDEHRHAAAAGRGDLCCPR